MISNNVLFSIAIPAYKSNFLAACIESILQQTYGHFELIIVNDCSPNPIDEIVHEFNDSRIRYFKNELNIGSENLVNNWNACLEKANGDFFMMMGDDDRLETNYLEEFLLLISKYPNLDVFHCRSKIIDENSTPFGLTLVRPEFESVYDTIYNRLMGYRLQYVSDFVYRTSILRANGGYYYLPLAWSSDDITSYIACGSKGIAHTNKTVFNYRSNRFSISSSGNDFLKMKAICGEKAWLDNFLLQEPLDYDDKIMRSELVSIVGKRIQRKKIYSISVSLEKPTFKKLYLWYSNRIKYEYSVKDIFYALLQGLNHRRILKRSLK